MYRSAIRSGDPLGGVLGPGSRGWPNWDGASNVRTSAASVRPSGCARYIRTRSPTVPDSPSSARHADDGHQVDGVRPIALASLARTPERSSLRREALLLTPIGARRFLTRTTHEQWGWCAPKPGLDGASREAISPYGNNRRFESCRGHTLTSAYAIACNICAIAWLQPIGDTAMTTTPLAAVERARREQAALVARADQQHAWVLAGDAAASTANTHQSKSRLMLVVSGTRGCALQRLFWSWDL